MLIIFKFIYIIHILLKGPSEWDSYQANIHPVRKAISSLFNRFNNNLFYLITINISNIFNTFNNIDMEIVSDKGEENILK